MYLPSGKFYKLPLAYNLWARLAGASGFSQISNKGIVQRPHKKRRRPNA
jgi:hypothetical protein